MGEDILDLCINLFIALLVCFSVILSCILVYITLDSFLGYKQNIEVTVLDKIYYPKNSSFGIMPIVSGSGVSVGMLSTVNHESYILVLKNYDGTIFKKNVSAKFFYLVKIDQLINIDIIIGKFSNEIIED